MSIDLDPAVRDRIEQTIRSNPVVLFMKGTPKMPMCGFSARTVAALDTLLDQYASVNVLEDEAIREGIKLYGNWPTIPQLYIHGELIGGCDIVTELFNSGELHDLLGLDKPDRTPPEIEITDRAAEKIRQFVDEYPGSFLHFAIDADWEAQFNLGPKQGHEIETETAGITLLMDLNTAHKARGARIDWVSTVQGEGLKLDLPGAPPEVRNLTAAELQQRLNDGERIVVVDTRPADQRQAPALDFARGLDQALMEELKQADRATPLVFVCAHGVSSRDVAEYYRKQGFVQVYNLEGGVAGLFPDHA